MIDLPVGVFSDGMTDNARGDLGSLRVFRVPSGAFAPAFVAIFRAFLCFRLSGFLAGMTGFLTGSSTPPSFVPQGLVFDHECRSQGAEAEHR